MTRKAHSSEFTEFSGYLRGLGGVYPQRFSSRRISNQNLDFIWHCYKENWFILIEEKRYGGMRNKGANFAQKDTHGVLDQLLKISSGSVIKNARNKDVNVEYRGYYRIVFENTTPLDGWMEINGERRTEWDLKYLLNRGKLHESEPKKEVVTN